MTLAFLNIGPIEIILLAVVGLLLFGRRLPEVGKNLGKGIVEFKKGLSGVEEDVNRSGNAAPPQQPPQYQPPQQPNLLQQSSAQIQPNQPPASGAVNQNTNTAATNQHQTPSA